MFSVRQLGYYVAIVEAGSFSEAAEWLHVAQSALSRQIKLLEEEVGVALLARTTRQVEMTAAGRAFHEDAVRMLAGLGEMAGRARQAERGVQGSVALLHSSSVPLGRSLLAPLRRHLSRQPGVSLSISSASSEQQAQDIQDGRADLGLARAPVLRQLPDVLTEVLYEEALVLAVPAGHPLAGRDAVPLHALRGERFVSLPHAHRGGLSYRVVELCRQAGFFPQAAQAVSRKATLLRLVELGFGVALVPADMAAEARAEVGLVALAECDARTQVLLHVHRSPTPQARQVADALRAACAGWRGLGRADPVSPG
ncbi:LysR substrate-binding domain-containing protein [Pigmentiphaga sp. D-2]|uniref:LysR substrate-binding domain-containing protein n=1 Tax=Pigmentiphaga sp. D-2 TaxID=1002116 RepID=UPI00104848A7|nr:LysR substrate-binding domain-containing protein [Pigmentiphaga sp. D-2]